jgi:hypothetical protein
MDRVRIPVFVSCPTNLNDRQRASRELVDEVLRELQLEPRAIGRSDYPTDLPLREVLTLAKHCSGGIILGFEQVFVERGVAKRGTGPGREVPLVESPMPTAWNQIEAGILFGLGLPILVFRERGITGGVFDEGVTDVFVHPMPDPSQTEETRDAFSGVMLKWQSRVRSIYYAD